MLLLTKEQERSGSELTHQVQLRNNLEAAPRILIHMLGNSAAMSLTPAPFTTPNSSWLHQYRDRDETYQLVVQAALIS